MLYTSIENKKIKELKKLTIKKHRDKTDLFLIEGLHIIKEALKNNSLKELYVLENEEVQVDFKADFLTSKVMKYLTNMASIPRYIGVCQKKTPQKIGNKVLILDDIQDPGNLGGIIRSAFAFNIDTILLSKNTTDLYNDKVIRSSQGMLFNINILKVNIEEEIKKLKKEKYIIIGTKIDKGKDIKDFKKLDKFVIIMGNEGNGVSSNILSLCDDYIYIKMNQECESLNVLVATSIILYELDK